MKPQAAAAQLRVLYEKMLLIRTVESELSRLFANSEIPGFIHLSIGQEAIAAGVCSAFADGDTMATNHRGHGHVLARGMKLDGFFMELFGRRGGRCGGRGGSMHVADFGLGLLGANGIVGAGVPLALGSALAHRTRGTGGIAAVFFGDGAMAEGALHEALNMAALWHLPLLLICENNGWSEFSPTNRQFCGTLGGLAGAFGVAHVKVDGNDVEETSAAAEKAVSHVRGGEPFILECMTTRVRGHFEGDPQKYRTRDELAGLDANDPLRRAAERLRMLGIEADDLARLSDAVEGQVASAVASARQADQPDFDEALADVYTRPEARR